MGWRSRLKGWATRDQVERANDTFSPREWNEHFASLAPDKRRAFAVDLCRRVVAGAGVHEGEAERAITALAQDRATDDLIRSIRSLVQRFEGEYDPLIGDDESKLACTDPEIVVASRRMLAAWALRCALEGDLSGLAYYAWFVLEDLAEIRRLAGMPMSNHESA